VTVNSRSKGARAERLLAQKFSAWWGSDFTRTPSSGGFSTKKFRDDWNAAGDLVTPDETFPFCVESKHAEGWHLEQVLTSPKCAIIKWWEQTVGETPKGKIPLLVFTRNRQPHFYMLPVDRWLPRTKNKGVVLVVSGVRVRLGLLDDLVATTPEEWISGKTTTRAYKRPRKAT